MAMSTCVLWAKDLSRLISNNRHSGFLADLHKTKHTLNHIFAFPLPFVGITCASGPPHGHSLTWSKPLDQRGLFPDHDIHSTLHQFLPPLPCVLVLLPVLFIPGVQCTVGCLHSGFFFCNILNRNPNETFANPICVCCLSPTELKVL